MRKRTQKKNIRMPRMPDPNATNAGSDIRNIRIRIRRFGCSSGFSLIELLVSVGIFVVVSAFLLANFRRGREADTLRTAASTLAANIQRTQALALAGSSADGNAAAFGVHSVKGAGEYTLFGDRGRIVGGTPEAPNRRYDAGEALTSGVIALPSHVIIDAVGDASATDVDVLFELPRASVVIWPSASEARIMLRYEGTSSTKAVTVNRVSGQIGVE